MKYAYEDLSPEQFERLVVFLCQKLLGMGVQGFAKGRDGGRDAKFVGTAQAHPSTSGPWTGTVVIQAKHTNGYNKHFSESEFFNPKAKTTVIGEETPRIKALRDAKQLDHYMLFSNRRLAANAESAIRSHISSACGLPEPSIALFGVDDLERLLRTYPEVADQVDLDPVDSPLIVSPQDLAEVVEALAQHKDVFSHVEDTPPVPRTSYEDKNDLNNMTPGYAKALRRRYLKETAKIRDFLAAPENEAILRAYEAVVEEFELKILAKRKDHQTFDEVMEHLLELLFARDAILRQRPHKPLTRAIVFYMYWNCDIGTQADA
ncbi:MAG: restriction endonuclease [Phenylobacterium sp.]|nr:restriction endonuclease [Phenylobacterium sp.]